MTSRNLSQPSCRHILIISFITSFLCISLSTYAVTPHPESAWVTRNYPNSFLRFGLGTSEEINAKLQASYAQLFGPYDESGNGRNETGSILRNHQGGIDAQFIYAFDSDDIRSEGMSYGMMIAVMMNDQTTFDRLWRFVVREMWQTNDGQIIGDVFESRGGSITPRWVGWKHNATSPYSANTSQGGNDPAPDGEEYMAMALFFAHHRWGSSDSNSGLENWTRNYYARANDLLDVIRNHLWSSSANQILFSPGSPYTDPSYHLPAFYELFGEWADSSGDRSFWKAAADTSRQLLRNSAHSTTGLATSYSNFDGTPVAANTNGQWFANAFAFDSWRVIQNVAMDYYWWSQDSYMQSIVTRQLVFFLKQTDCGGSYCNIYTWSGGVPNNVPSGARGRSAGHIAMNAVGALGGQGTAYPRSFMEELWTMDTPSGTYRYYDGLLYMLAYLHLSGNYIIHQSGTLTGAWLDRDDPTGTADSELMSLQSNIRSYPCRNNPTSVITAWDGSPMMYSANYPNRLDYLNAARGLSCSNNGQQCLDYEVSYFCGNASGGQTWTSYYDASNPTSAGETESPSSHNLPSSCTHRWGIRARVVGTTTFYYGPPDHLETFSVQEGLRCLNADQPAGRTCKDYRFRLSCR